MILIDTNVFVDHLRGHKPATEFFESLTTRDDVIFSAITEAELIAGKECNDSNKREILLRFLHRWDKMPVSNQIALMAGDISRDHDLEAPDAIIAATALVNKAEVVTKNVKDFKRVTDLEINVPY